MAALGVCIFVMLSILPIHYAQDSFMLAADMVNVKVHRIDLLSGNVSSLNIQGLGSVTDVLYDHKSKHMYVTDYMNRTIHRCTLSGTQCSTYRTGIGYPDRTAIDYSTGNLYYTADASPLTTQTYGYIGIINPSRNAHAYLLSGLRKPRGIVLYPSKGLMFWTDHAYPYHHLGRSSMDGSNAKVLLNIGAYWPNGVTIDYSGDRIYWTDGYYNRIASCDLNGQNRLVHFEDPGSHMMGIVIKGSYIYYSAWKRSIITKVDRSNFTVSPWMESAPQFGRIDSISIYPADSQPNNQMCSNNNGGCNTFCIPKTSTTVVCKCDDLVTGSVNNKTCQKEDPNTPIYCNNSIPNGGLENGCIRSPGTSCDYSCEKGYKKIKEEMIICLINGQWSENVASLCRAIYCNNSIPNGGLENGCIRSPGTSCDYSCEKGYKKIKEEMIICLVNGQWSENVASLCRELRVDSIQSSPQSTTIMGAGVGAGVAVILIVAAVVVVIIVIRKGFLRRSRSGEHVQVNRTTDNAESAPPPVYYLPDDQVMFNPYLTPIGPPPLYDEIDTRYQYDASCYQSLEKGSKSQNGTTGNSYETLNVTTETNPYTEHVQH